MEQKYISASADTRYQSAAPSINVYGDAVVGFGVGVAVGALLAFYLMTRTK